MSIALVAAALVFIAILGFALVVTMARAQRRTIAQRLRTAAPEPGENLLLQVAEPAPQRGGRSRLLDALAILIEQAGRTTKPRDVLLIIAGHATVGLLLGWFRLGSVLWGLAAAALIGMLPLAYLAYQRQQRVKAFEEHFPEALDMMSRSIRAGYALAGGIQLVSEEMPEPVGGELRRVSEEIRLGVEPGDALAKLRNRMPTADVGFFCTAIRIQRSAGGNLAEMLDRLGEVIRARFAVLGQARALSAQQRYAAVIVGVSPAAFAILMRLLNPHYFDPLFASPLGLKLLLLGFVMEIIGFVMIWRIAKIKI